MKGRELEKRSARIATKTKQLKTCVKHSVDKKNLTNERPETEKTTTRKKLFEKVCNSMFVLCATVRVCVCENRQELKLNEIIKFIV